VSLVHIDDVIKHFIKIMDEKEKNLNGKDFKFINNEYGTKKVIDRKDTTKNKR
jgi:hypothetical protein